MAEIGIVIVNYNGEKFQNECIRSIYGSTFKDIVLVNNCVGFSLSPFYGTQKVIAYDYPMKCEVIIT